MLDAPPTGRIGRFLDATQEVAKLTKFGPINQQSEGVIKLLHGPQTAVHLVTLLEEMPVQETIDAAAELRGRLPARRRDRQPGPARADRPTDQVGADGTVDAERARRRAAQGRRRRPRTPPALAAEMAEYAQRQRVQDENAARLDALDLPRIELPDLNPPVELGELNELAACFRRRTPQ